MSQSHPKPLIRNGTFDTYNVILGDAHSDVWINAKTTMAPSIQAEINQQKEDIPLTEQILKEYHQYLDIFDENKAECFPEA